MNAILFGRYCEETMQEAAALGENSRLERKKGKNCLKTHRLAAEIRSILNVHTIRRGLKRGENIFIKWGQGKMPGRHEG